MDIDVSIVFEKNGKSIQSYSPEEFTPLEIKKRVDLNVHHYALFIVPEENNEKSLYVDLSLMMQEQLVGNTDTWEEFKKLLTSQMIDSYSISSSGIDIDNNYKQYSVIQPFTTIGLNISYCNKNDTSVTDRFYSRWEMPDLVISKKQEFLEDVKKINLKNCIVSVNGLITKSYFFEDKLYVTDGAKNLWSINNKNSPNMTMIDVTNLGELHYLPLSSCTLIYNGNDTWGEELFNSDIKIILPKEYSFQEFTPILVIAGKAYFSDELVIPSERSIFYSPYKTQLHTHILQLYEAHAEYIAHSEIIYPEMTPLTYISNLGKTEMSDNYDGIFLIKNPNIHIQRKYLLPDLFWMTKRNLDRNGLIIRMTDKSWMDYTTIEYDTGDIYNFQKFPQDLIRITTNDYINNQGAVKNLRCNHSDKYFSNIKNSPYEIIYLTC